MNGREAIALMGRWLYEHTKDEGVKNEEVLNVLFYAHSSGKKKRGWKKILNDHLTIGLPFVSQFLNDSIEMERAEFWKKYY